MKKLYIYCAGGLGKEVVALAQRIQAVSPTFESIAYIDDTKNNQPVHGIPSCTYETFCKNESREQSFIVLASGEPFFREMLFEKIKQDGYSFATLIDPNATVCEGAQIGEGCIVMGGACISPDAILGNNVLLYYNTVASHDVVIEEHSVLSIGTTVGGYTRIGRRTYIGMGCTVKDRITVGQDTIVGLGSLVLKDVPCGCVAYGNPCKEIRKNDNHRVF